MAQRVWKVLRTLNLFWTKNPDEGGHAVQCVSPQDASLFRLLPSFLPPSYLLLFLLPLFHFRCLHRWHSIQCHICSVGVTVTLENITWSLLSLNVSISESTRRGKKDKRQSFNPLELLKQNTIISVAYKQQEFISQGSGGWKCKVRYGYNWVLLRFLCKLKVCSLLIVSSHCRRGKWAPLSLFYNHLITS